LPSLLFDLQSDPDELHNIAEEADYQPIRQRLHARLVQDWDPPLVHERILQSQRRRLFLADVAAGSGLYPNWAFQPYVDESLRFIRGSGAAGPTSVKAKARFPFVEPVPPDKKPPSG
jgi:choline-sulfatase